MKRSFIKWMTASAFLWCFSAGGETVIEEVIDVPVVENPAEVPEEEPVEEIPSEIPADKVSFMNGDQLQGLLVSVKPEDGTFVWQSPHSVKPMELSLEDADKVQLKPRDASGKKWGDASVRLSNDDELWGNIVKLDSDQLKLKTWYSGSIDIKRSMIARIKVQNDDSTVMYEGPKSLKNWVAGHQGKEQSWQYKKGALYSQAQYPIAKKIEGMPDKAKIEFDLKWRGSYPGMAVSFFNDNTRHQSDCYTITISGSSIYLYRYSRNTGSSHMGNANFKGFRNGGNNGGKFTILADRKEKKVALLIDGTMVKQWVDKTADTRDGDVLMFYPQNQNGVKISDIKVSAWDGTLSTDRPEDVEKVSEDLIRLANGDKVSGEVKTIGSGNVQFKASYADMEIPLSRIVEIVFAENKRERARRNKNDAQFVLLNGGLLTLDLAELRSDEAIGSSENVGDLRLPLSAAREMEFNLYAEKPLEDDFEF